MSAGGITTVSEFSDGGSSDGGGQRRRRRGQRCRKRRFGLGADAANVLSRCHRSALFDARCAFRRRSFCISCCRIT
uniref:Uncharacterized protein n=1 Tax=Macrostomum lignano TaxID=282301 RepID=A0A1I8G7E2_9PLAT